MQSHEQCNILKPGKKFRGYIGRKECPDQHMPPYSVEAKRKNKNLVIKKKGEIF